MTLDYTHLQIIFGVLLLAGIAFGIYHVISLKQAIQATPVAPPVMAAPAPHIVVLPSAVPPKPEVSAPVPVAIHPPVQAATPPVEHSTSSQVANQHAATAIGLVNTAKSLDTPDAPQHVKDAAQAMTKTAAAVLDAARAHAQHSADETVK